MLTRGVRLASTRQLIDDGSRTERGWRSAVAKQERNVKFQRSQGRASCCTD